MPAQGLSISHLRGNWRLMFCSFDSLFFVSVAHLCCSFNDVELRPTMINFAPEFTHFSLHVSETFIESHNLEFRRLN